MRVLTDAAQLPRPRLRRTDAGTWVEDSDAEPERTDFAGFLAAALAAVAANAGGQETLRAGRDGSWEADLVRQLVAGTAGYGDEHLWGYRTDPLNITLYVEEIVNELSWSPTEGDRSTMDYFEAAQEVGRRYEAAAAESPDVYTRDRVWKYVRNEAGELVSTDPGAPAWSIEAWRALPRTQQLPEETRSHFEASLTGDEENMLFPGAIAQTVYLPKTPELDEEIARLEAADDARLAPFGDLEERLEAQRIRELTEYGQALKTRIEALAALKGLEVPVNVEVNIEDFRPQTAGHPADLEQELIEAAIQDTPNPNDLPGTPLERVERTLDE
ncbi:MAG: hypothetical protein ACRDS9_15295 [Pseudonocardiaceae bacterium]